MNREMQPYDPPHIRFRGNDRSRSLSSFSVSLITSCILYANKGWESLSISTAEGRRRVHIHEHDQHNPAAIKA